MMLFRDPAPAQLFVTDVLRCLSAHRFDATTEERLQLGIASALSTAGLELEREVVLAPGSRIDFLSANGIGIEVKIDGSETSVLRQLMRYAESDRVTALVLFTTRSKHLSMPAMLRGKLLSVYFQGGI
ncbi:MAG TPA: hypothetical protein VHM19_23425 [Polyangiales bacterium]|jgi:hypothetical protein|nr:hypothetical protein [Polyangiales bacterium]